MLKKTSLSIKKNNTHNNIIQSKDTQKKKKIENVFKWLFKNKNKLIMNQISPDFNLLDMVNNKTDINLIKDLFLENYFNENEKVEIYIKLLKNVDINNFKVIKKALNHHVNLTHKELSQNFIFLIEQFDKLQYWKIYFEDLNEEDLLIQDDLGYNIIHYFILWLDFHSSEIIELANKIKEMDNNPQNFNPFLLGNSRVLNYLIIGTMGHGTRKTFKEIILKYKKDGKIVFFDPIEILKDSSTHVTDVENHEQDIIDIVNMLEKLSSFKQALSQENIAQLKPLDLAKEDLSILVKRIVAKNNLEYTLNQKLHMSEEKKSVKKI